MAERISVAGDKVVVGAKLPHGLIMRIFDMVDGQDPQPGGGVRDIKRAQPRDETVTIKGYLRPYSGDEPPPPAITSQWAFTENLDRDFIVRWFKENHDHDMVRNQIIFFANNLESARARARELEAMRNGLEPIDRDRLPKGIQTAKTS